MQKSMKNRFPSIFFFTRMSLALSIAGLVFSEMSFGWPTEAKGEVHADQPQSSSLAQLLHEEARLVFQFLSKQQTDALALTSKRIHTLVRENRFPHILKRREPFLKEAIRSYQTYLNLRSQSLYDLSEIDLTHFPVSDCRPFLSDPIARREVRHLVLTGACAKATFRDLLAGWSDLQHLEFVVDWEFGEEARGGVNGLELGQWSLAIGGLESLESLSLDLGGSYRGFDMSSFNGVTRTLHRLRSLSLYTEQSLQVDLSPQVIARGGLEFLSYRSGSPHALARLVEASASNLKTLRFWVRLFGEEEIDEVERAIGKASHLDRADVCLLSDQTHARTRIFKALSGHGTLKSFKFSQTQYVQQSLLDVREVILSSPDLEDLKLSGVVQSTQDFSLLFLGLNNLPHFRELSLWHRFAGDRTGLDLLQLGKRLTELGVQLASLKLVGYDLGFPRNHLSAPNEVPRGLQSLSSLDLTVSSMKLSEFTDFILGRGPGEFGQGHGLVSLKLPKLLGQLLEDEGLDEEARRERAATLLGAVHEKLVGLREIVLGLSDSPRVQFGERLMAFGTYPEMETLSLGYSSDRVLSFRRPLRERFPQLKLLKIQGVDQRKLIKAIDGFPNGMLLLESTVLIRLSPRGEAEGVLDRDRIVAALRAKGVACVVLGTIF